MKNENVIEGEAIEQKPKKTESQELAVVQEKPQAQLIIGENSVEKASKVATALANVIEKQQLFVNIQSKKYVMVEGWNTLGALIGVFPEVLSVEKLPARKVKLFQVEQTKYKKGQNGGWENYTIIVLMNPAFFNPSDERTRKLQEIEFDEIAYKATVALKTVQGDLISKAEAFCSNLEESKYKNDEYAINSMAQTRATGKAFRLAFSWIMSMAGYEATPAEEIPRDGFENNAPAQARPAQTARQSYNQATPNDEIRYEPVKENTPPPAKPWQKWENGRSPRPATNQARPAQPAQTFFNCSDCGEGIADVVKDYSEKFYGKMLCRKCQPNHQKIR